MADQKNNELKEENKKLTNENSQLAIKNSESCKLADQKYMDLQNENTRIVELLKKDNQKLKDQL